MNTEQIQVQMINLLGLFMEASVVAMGMGEMGKAIGEGGNKSSIFREEEPITTSMLIARGIVPEIVPIKIDYVYKEEYEDMGLKQLFEEEKIIEEGLGRIRRSQPRLLAIQQILSRAANQVYKGHDAFFESINEAKTEMNKLGKFFPPARDYVSALELTKRGSRYPQKTFQYLMSFNQYIGDVMFYQDIYTKGTEENMETLLKVKSKLISDMIKRQKKEEERKFKALEKGIKEGLIDPEKLRKPTEERKHLGSPFEF